jgi:hypothetical protein
MQKEPIIRCSSHHLLFLAVFRRLQLNERKPPEDGQLGVDSGASLWS